MCDDTGAQRQPRGPADVPAPVDHRPVDVGSCREGTSTTPKTSPPRPPARSRILHCPLRQQRTLLQCRRGIENDHAHSPPPPPPPPAAVTSTGRTTVGAAVPPAAVGSLPASGVVGPDQATRRVADFDAIPINPCVRLLQITGPFHAPPQRCRRRPVLMLSQITACCLWQPNLSDSAAAHRAVCGMGAHCFAVSGRCSVGRNCSSPVTRSSSRAEAVGVAGVAE